MSRTSDECGLCSLGSLWEAKQKESGYCVLPGIQIYAVINALQGNCLNKNDRELYLIVADEWDY